MSRSCRPWACRETLRPPKENPVSRVIALRWGYDLAVAQMVTEVWRELYPDRMLSSGWDAEWTARYLNTRDWLASGWDGERCIGACWGLGDTSHIGVRTPYRGRWLGRSMLGEFFETYWLLRDRIAVSPPATMGPLFLRLGGRQRDDGVIELHRADYEPMGARHG